MTTPTPVSLNANELDYLARSIRSELRRTPPTFSYVWSVVWKAWVCAMLLNIAIAAVAFFLIGAVGIAALGGASSGSSKAPASTRGR